MSSALDSGDVDPLLLAFTDAALDGSATDHSAALANLQAARGDAAVVDAAGVIANFAQMNRIADATGISLDAPTQLFAAQLIAENGFDEFASAQNTERMGTVQRVAGKGLRRLAPTVVRARSMVSKRRGRSQR